MLKKGQVFSKIIFLIVQVIFVVVVLGVIVSNIFPGLTSVFEESGTSKEIQSFVSDVDSTVCGNPASEGLLPPAQSAKQSYDFRDVERIESDGSNLQVLLKGQEKAEQIEFGCEDINQVVLCKNEEKRKAAAGCAEFGDDDQLSPGFYTFDYFLTTEGRLYIMVHREVEDQGPFIYYLSGETRNNELKAYSISEERVYNPREMSEGASVSRSYTGGTISSSGDLDMDGREDNIVIGNESYIFRYSMTDHSSESIKYGNPIQLYDVGPVTDIREGDVEVSEGNDCEPEWNTEENRVDLAKIIYGEADVSGVSDDVRKAIGYTVLRRMKEEDYDRVEDVSSGYLHGRDLGSADGDYEKYLGLAEDILTCRAEDIGRGATHYYSPRSMTKVSDYESEGGIEEKVRAMNEERDILPDSCDPEDISDLETVSELVESDNNPEGSRTLVPWWANEDLKNHPECSVSIHERVEVPEAREWFFKFYKNTEFEDYEFYERSFGKFGGNEIVFIDGEFESEERKLCVYNPLDDKALDCHQDKHTCKSEEIGGSAEFEESKKVFFSNYSRTIFYWNGSTGGKDYGCEEGSDFVDSKEIDYEGGEFYEKDMVEVSDLGTVSDIDNDGKTDDLVLVLNIKEGGSGKQRNTILGYVDLSESDERFDFNQIDDQGGIVSVGETHDRKIPLVINEYQEGYSLIYYDLEEEEVLETEAGEEPRMVGGFSDLMGGS